MGSLSTLSLQFNRQQLDGMRSEMAARGALAQLVAKLRQHDAGRELNPLRPEPSNVPELFPDGLRFQEGDHKVTIHFGSAQGFSVDNLGGDAPSIGWPDDDEVARVPPFALDIILNVEGPSGERRYRAGLKRVWPFALYSKRGPVLLMAVPGSGSANSPSKVKGDVYTSWDGNAAAGGTVRTGYGYGLLDDPSKVLANVEARAGYHPYPEPNHHLLIGSPLGYNPEQRPEVHRGSTAEKKFYHYPLSELVRKLDDTEDSTIFYPRETVGKDRGNLLEGDFLYSHSLDAEVPPAVETGSVHEGKTKVLRGLTLDPLEDLLDEDAGMAGFAGVSFQTLDLPEVEDDLAAHYGEVLPEDFLYDDGDGGKPPPRLLGEDLVLTETENSTGGPISSHYFIRGSVSNRQVAYVREGPKAGLFVKEMKAGLRLQDTVLYIAGDLDLSGTVLSEVGGDPEEQKFDIIGSGATLVVSGQLILGNATINAEDRGFVIYAKDIVLKGGGTFFGLMIAENSITILSQNNDLSIKGALLCAGQGGITLKGTELEHDPNYLKSINSGGDFVVTSWKKL